MFYLTLYYDARKHKIKKKKNSLYSKLGSSKSDIVFSENKLTVDELRVIRTEHCSFTHVSVNHALKLAVHCVICLGVEVTPLFANTLQHVSAVLPQV